MSVNRLPENNNEYELIEEGPVSAVSRTWVEGESGEPRWIVVKTATVVRKFSKEPHDIKKELRTLLDLSHPNIINVLSHLEEMATLHIWMPYIPISLSDLLASPSFSPYSSAQLSNDDGSLDRLKSRFNTVARSIMYQILSGLVYLHDRSRGIAHRDIKPNNVLLALDGCVKLIDFGIVWNNSEDVGAKRNDLWPEHQDKMYFEVSTGPYRAPELLFGTRCYDPFAIDLWSLGATFAEFFTPLRLSLPEEDDEYDPHYDDESTQPLKPFIIPPNTVYGDPDARWHRDTLFNGSRGELGLAWSIFKICGTPTADNWPSFDALPDAKGVTFNIVPAVSLSTLLPNLPPKSTGPHEGGQSAAYCIDEDLDPVPLDLLSLFLVYPSEKRLKATETLRHPWFTNDILLPPGYPDQSNYPGKHVIFELEGETLGQLLLLALGRERDER